VSSLTGKEAARQFHDPLGGICSIDREGVFDARNSLRACMVVGNPPATLVGKFEDSALNLTSSGSGSIWLTNLTRKVTLLTRMRPF